MGYPTNKFLTCESSGKERLPVFGLDVIDFSSLDEESVIGGEVDEVDVGVPHVLKKNVQVVAVEGDPSIEMAARGDLENAKLALAVRQEDPFQLGLESADDQVRLNFIKEIKLVALSHVKLLYLSGSKGLYLGPFIFIKEVKIPILS